MRTPASQPSVNTMAPTPSQRPEPATSTLAALGRAAGSAAAASGTPNQTSGTSDKKPSIIQRIKARLKRLSKKQWIIIGIIAVLILGGGGFGLYKLLHKEAPKPVQQAKVVAPPPEPPKPITSTLSGLVILDAAINQRPVTGVMIENSPDARPQSGLNQASVVFEAIAEGGITRFLTLFQDSEPDYIGPVRSVRPYYIQWGIGFDAAIAHVGGSGDALRMMKDLGSKDLDQFYNPAPFYRISSRYAPHNMYSSVIKIRELSEQKGNKSNFKGFARKAEAKSAAPNATSIDFNISSALYNPHYDYDAATNTYKRSEGGKPHIDEKSGAQLAPKTVVGLVMQQGANDIYTTYETIGSGEAYIFQDGVATKGTWHKKANNEQFTFTDVNGVELKLNPGQTWLSVVGGSDRVVSK